jgi:3-dehydroquinate synthetase
MHDKKFVGGRRLFVLLEGAGRPVVDVEVTEDLVREALARIR